MSDDLRMRPLVPTVRQDERPDAASTVEATTSRVEAEPSGLAAVSSFLKDLDPRGFAKSARLPLLVLGLASTVGQLDDAVLGLVGPEIQAEFGFPIVFLSVLASIFAVATTLMALPFGYLADRTSRVWVLRIGSLITNLGSVVQGLAGSLGVLVAGRMTSGFAAGSYQPASFSLLADYVPPRQRARAFGLLYSTAAVGTGVAPVIVGATAVAMGWRGAVLTLGVIATVVSALTFLLREPVRGAVDREELGIEESLVEAEPEPVGFGEAYRSMAAITTMRRIWYVTPVVIVLNGAGLLLLNFYYSEVYFLDAGQRGLVMALSASLGIVAILAGGPIGDRMLAHRPGRLLTLGAGIFVYQAVSYLLLSLSPNLVLSIMVTAPAVALQQALAPAFVSMISMIVPPRMRGLGIQTQAPWQLVGIVATPVVVGLATRGGGVRSGLLLFVPLYLIAAAITASAAPYVARDMKRAAKAAVDGIALSQSDELPLLAVRGLEVEIEGTRILDGVDLEVEAGELLALVGTNGAGKSTALRALAGLHHASAGLVMVDGQEITYLNASAVAAKGVHLLPGGHATIPGMSVGEHLALASRNPGRPADAPSVDAVLEEFPELSNLLTRQASDLSGGQQQVLALAMAFIVRPRVLLVDELSMGLAPQVVERLLGSLRRLVATGTAVILVEQSLQVAAGIADRAVFLDRGAVRFSGTVEELSQRQDLVRAIFLGGSGATKRRRPPRPGTSTVLDVDDVGVAFGGVTALDHVSLTAQAGQIVGIIGPNGAGKTTLFDAISGFAPLTHGHIEIGGVDVTGMSTHERAAAGLGRSFQRARLFPTMTVRDAVATFAHNRSHGGAATGALWLPSHRRNEQRLARSVEDLLDLLGLLEVADQRIGGLSTGQRRIVDLACVMAQRPRVLLLDEPSTGLAQAEVESLGPLLVRLVNDIDCALVLIEHDVALVSSISDRMVAMATGNVLAEGPPAEVLGNADVAQAYLSGTDETLLRSNVNLMADLLAGGSDKEL